MKAVEDKIVAAVAAVAKEKGMTVVLDAGSVVHGGTSPLASSSSRRQSKTIDSHSGWKKIKE